MEATTMMTLRKQFEAFALSCLRHGGKPLDLSISALTRTYVDLLTQTYWQVYVAGAMAVPFADKADVNGEIHRLFGFGDPK